MTIGLEISHLMSLPTCRETYFSWALHIVPFCEGPNKKPEGFAKEKQKT
jgi:hypothetical protein